MRMEGKPIWRHREGLEGSWGRRGKSKGIKEVGRKSCSVDIWDVLLPKSHSLSWDKSICDHPSKENSQHGPLAATWNHSNRLGRWERGKFQHLGMELGMDGLKSRKKGFDSRFPTPGWSVWPLLSFPTLGMGMECSGNAGAFGTTLRGDFIVKSTSLSNPPPPKSGMGAGIMEWQLFK